MKKIYILSIALYTLAITTQAQTPVSSYLDINNVKASINASGDLFTDFTNAQFEVPKNSGKNTIFAGSLWIGGVDAGGQLKIAAQTYRQNGTDFWPGPLDVNATTTPSTINTYNKVWKINQCDIDAYSNWFISGTGPNPVGPIAMDVINTWPAFNPNGSPLAPFVDYDNDGLYDPSLGDYPKIKGDQAIFFVYNDKGGTHTETGGQAIGLEIQGMIYAYSCPKDSALYNTIFTNYKIINKSIYRLDSAFIGNWTDIDIGGAGTGYVGSDVTRGAYYGYDATSSNAIYGANPPAQAVVFLRGPWADPNGIDDASISTASGINYGDGIVDNERLGMGKFMYYNNDFTVQGNPTLAVQYYQYLNDIWKDGTPLTYAGDGHLGSIPCDYAFPGNSDPLGYGTSMVPASPWTATGTAYGDKRGVGSFGPFTFQPGAIQEVDFAYVFGRATSGGNLASVAVMQDRIDSVRTKFNNGITGCGCNGSVTGINNLSKNDLFTFYPNPATNNITLNFKTSAKNYSVKIYDATGRLVKNNEHVNSSATTVNIEDLNSGIYLLNVYDGTNSVTHRFVKQ